MTSLNNVSIPVDIIDLIVDELTYPSDILSFALTSKELYGLVRLDQARVRILRIVPDVDLDILQRLENDHALARNVHAIDVRTHISATAWHSYTVELLPRLRPPIASNLWNRYYVSGDAEEQEADTRLMRALSGMTHLHALRWAKPHPRGDPELEGSDLFCGLSQIHTLRDIHILDSQPETHGPWLLSKAKKSELWQLHDLLAFVYELGESSSDVDSESANAEEDGEESGTFELNMGLINAMVGQNSPNLSSLEILFHTEVAPLQCDVLLTTFHWHSLQSIRLFHTFCAPEAVSSFLSSHPSLEEVTLESHLTIEPSLGYQLPPGILPNLRLLACTTPVAIAILSSPLPPGSPPRPVEDIRNVTLHPHPSLQLQNEEFIELIHEEILPHLRQLHLLISRGPSDIQTIRQAAPKLTSLDCGWRQIRPEQNLDVWIAAARSFPTLERLFGTQLFSSWNKARSDTEANYAAAELAKHCPNLREVNWKLAATHTPYVALWRDEAGNPRWEVKNERPAKEVGMPWV